MMFKIRSAKIAKTLDVLLWFFVMILPLVVMVYHRDAGYTLTQAVGVCSPFGYVQDIFESVFSKVFGDSLAISSYASYLVLVEVVHIFVDALLFVPRIARKMMDGWVGL